MDRELETVVDRVDLSAFRGDKVRAALERLRDHPQGERRDERRERPDPEQMLAEYVAAVITDLWDPRSTDAANCRRVQAALDDASHRLAFTSRKFLEKGNRSEQG